ncbi:MAG TPA: hypothetical protein VJQ82_04355 [Terriglobales bacterium]|nr:hypothetical protein [Terriglobales bacterium]
MMQLEIVQVAKLAAVTPRDILRFFEIVSLGRSDPPAILAIHEY